MSTAKYPPTKGTQDRRIDVRLPVRRLNVLIAGTLLSTVDISANGARIHCSKEQFPLIRPQLSGEIEISIELPIGREVSATAHVCHIQQEPSDVFIGLAFESFHYRDEAGWLAFMASKRREFDREEPSLEAQSA